MRWTDFAMLAVVTGHRRGELTRARELQHVQTGFVRRLLSGTAAPAEVRIGVSALGLDPDGGYYAVHARLDPTTTVGELLVALRSVETLIEVWWAQQAVRLRHDPE